MATPGRLRATQRVCSSQCAAAAAWRALASSTPSTASAIATSGVRQLYCSWASGAGRLSAVKLPADRIASFSDQPPVCGSIDSWVAFVRAYIVVRATFAPGARAAECAAAIGPPPGAGDQSDGSAATNE